MCALETQADEGGEVLDRAARLSIVMFMATLRWLPRSSQLQVIKNPLGTICYVVLSVSMAGPRLRGHGLACDSLGIKLVCQLTL